MYLNYYCNYFISCHYINDFVGRPPPLWKVTILTIVPLQLIVWSIAGSLIPLLISKGYNIALILFFVTLTTVFTNIYVGLPLMYLFFSSWLRAPRRSIGDMEWWVAILDSGLPSLWQKLLVIIIYYSFSLGFGFTRTN
jgi:hypothetical protein